MLHVELSFLLISMVLPTKQTQKPTSLMPLLPLMGVYGPLDLIGNVLWVSASLFLLAGLLTSQAQSQTRFTE